MPVGSVRSERTPSESTEAPGSRVTCTESVSAVPSQVYGAETNGSVPLVVSVVGVLWSAPVLPCQVADVTPFVPSAVSWRENG